MYHQEMMPESGHVPSSRLVDVIQDCEAICEYTGDAILRSQYAPQRREQLSLLKDCADICTLTAKYVARCSEFAMSTAALCAEICEICGNHCLMHPDELSQRCGQICLHCARECRAFAMAA